MPGNTPSDWNQDFKQQQHTFDQLVFHAAKSIGGGNNQTQKVKDRLDDLNDNLTALDGDFTAIIANPAVSDADKVVFLQTVYSELFFLRPQINGLENLLRFRFTVGGVFSFENEFALIGPKNDGLVQKFNAIRGNFGLGGLIL